MDPLLLNRYELHHRDCATLANGAMESCDCDGQSVLETLVAALAEATS